MELWVGGLGSLLKPVVGLRLREGRPLAVSTSRTIAAKEEQELESLGGLHVQVHYLDLLRPSRSTLWQSSDRFRLLCFGVGPSLRHQSSKVSSPSIRETLKATLTHAACATGARALVIGSERLLSPTFHRSPPNSTSECIDVHALDISAEVIADPYLRLQKELLEDLVNIVSDLYFLPLPRVRNRNMLTYLNPDLERARRSGSLTVEHPCTTRAVISVSGARDAIKSALSLIEDSKPFSRQKLHVQSNWVTFAEHFAADPVLRAVPLLRSHTPLPNCAICPADRVYPFLELFHLTGG